MKIQKHFLSLHFSLIILCCLNTFNVLSQPAIVQQRCFGGSLEDDIRQIIELPDGNYAAIGSSESIDGDLTGNNGGFDFWLIKFDPAFNILWQRNYGGTLGDWGEKIVAYSDGGFVFGGVTESNDIEVSGNHGMRDYWIVKTDSIGDIEWQRCLGSSMEESGSIEIELYPNGDLLFAGDVTLDDGNIDTLIGYADVWLTRLDSSGTILWQNTVGGTDIDRLFDLIILENKEIVISGYTRSNNVNISGNHGIGDAFIMKLDSVGTFIWSKCYGGMGEDYAFSILNLQDSGFVVVGTVNSPGGDISGYHSHVDGRILRLDLDGNILWQRCLGGSSVDVIETVIETVDNGFLIAGWTISIDGDVTGPIIGNGDVWFLKLDGAGNILWNSIYGGSSSEYIYTILSSANGNLLCAGSTRSNDYDVSGSHGNKEGWIWKLSDVYNSITGEIYYDVNNDTIQDPLEPLAKHSMITETNTGKIAFTTPTGKYRFILADSGSFNIQPVLQNVFYSAYPDSQQVGFSGFLLNDTINVFHLQPTGSFNELCIYLSQNSTFRPGQASSYTVSYTNTGTTSLNADITFFKGNFTVIDSATILPILTSPDSIVWSIGSIAPFQNGSFIIYVRVDTSAVSGDVVESSATIGPMINFENRDCSNSQLYSTITTAYDPNNIVVDKFSYCDTLSLDPPSLFYRINFQNVGTDTAFNVVVNNYVPQKLNIYSFEFIGASHPMQLSYNEHLRILSFSFDSIQLPDSTTNELASHGYILYEAKPVTGLISGDSIENIADIYFDYNFPVRTNKAITIIESPTGIANLNSSYNFCNLLYPNPAQDFIALPVISESPYEISVINNQGLEVIDAGSNSGGHLDISTLTSGVYVVKMVSKTQTCVSKFIKLYNR